MSGAPLTALAAHLRGADPLLAGAAREPAPGLDASVGSAAAAGEDAYALTVEAAREGQLIHAGAGRVFAGGDADLAILAGDYLYAFGLGRLAEAGDLESVAVLADTITTCARAHAEGSDVAAERAWIEAAGRIAARPPAC